MYELIYSGLAFTLAAFVLYAIGVGLDIFSTWWKKRKP